MTGGVSLVSAPSQHRIEGVKKKNKKNPAIIRVAEVEEVKLQLQTGATALAPSTSPASFSLQEKKKESLIISRWVLKV